MGANTVLTLYVFSCNPKLSSAASPPQDDVRYDSSLLHVFP